MSKINLEVANTYRQRAKGLIGRKTIATDSALLLKPAYFSIHTFGVKMEIDVAFLDSKLFVCKTKSVKPNRFASSLKCRAVLEAPVGSFEKWGIKTGVQLEVNQSELVLLKSDLTEK